MVLNINTNNIQEGMIIKSYRELCKLLDLPISSGNTKIMQLREINRYMDLLKDNNKFIVLEIYDKPLPSNINSKYTTLIQNILLDYLSKNNQDIVYINKNDLIKILGLVNNKYIEYRNKKEELITIYKDLDEYNINEFYKRCDAKICSILESSLKSLKKRFLLDYSDAYKFYILDNQNNDKYYIADNEEHKYILKVKRDVLLEMNLSSEYQIYLDNNTRKEFYKRVNQRVQEDKCWEGVFQCYKIICNPIQVTEALTDERYRLNHEVKKAINKQAENNYNKFYLPSNYLELQNTLSDILIEINKRGI